MDESTAAGRLIVVVRQGSVIVISKLKVAYCEGKAVTFPAILTGYKPISFIEVL
jgi:hypothetical protein